MSVVALCLGGSSALVRAEEEISSATPTIIDTLRRDAVRDRRLAESNLEAARVRRNLEAMARRNAARTSDPLEKRWWLDDVAGYVPIAEELEAYARHLIQQADAFDARAARLQAALDGKN